jgi:hypothetical protein
MEGMTILFIQNLASSGHLRVKAKGGALASSETGLGPRPQRGCDSHFFFGGGALWLVMV